MTMQTSSFDCVGEQYQNFIVKKVTPIDELRCTLVELEHEPTGARVIHLGNNDPENLFCLSFKTLPETSNGVAHILEHTVLCGSEKFPVKDPFFSMTRRSLNTFMNALTGADFTCYPAASQVTKDFYNLLEVYLDAVFKPKIDELSFLQEGHRFEFATANDPDTALEYKGIVFNEMKGAMSAPESRLWEAMNSALFPDLTYGINSGGAPKVIPELTYEGLLEFHRTFYHPARCLFFFYGNLPLKQHLDFLEKNALNGIEKVDPIPAIPKQPRHKKPIRKDVTYPISEGEELKDKTLISLGWLTAPIADQKELFALSILETILMDTDASLLKKPLLKSGLCKQAGSHIDEECSEVPLILLLRGCEPENGDAIEKLVRDTLENVVKEGIAPELIESALHQFELDRCEIGGDGYPYGLILFFRSGLLQQHGIEPERGLRIHSLFAELRESLKDPQYLLGLIEKHLLNNPHQVRVVMKPDPTQSSREEADEHARLAEIRSKLTSEQIIEICETAKQLKELQDTDDDSTIECLPKVTLQDVPTAAVTYPVHKETVGNLNIWHHDCFTNELAYLDLVFDLPHIPERDLSVTRLFVSLLSQMGSGGRDYVENLNYIQAHTGGVAASMSLNLQAEDSSQCRPTIQIRGKALTRNLDKLCPLMVDTLTSADFTDTERLKELLMKHWAGLQSSITSAAMKYASNLSASQLSVAGRISNSWGGLEYYKAIERIIHEFEANPTSLVTRLTNLQTSLLTLHQPTLVVGGDTKLLETLKGADMMGLASLSGSEHSAWTGQYPVPKHPSQGRVIAAPVAFTSRTIPTVSYTDQQAPALSIAGNLMDNSVLHKRIREQGGAYGGGTGASPLAGTFGFFGFRDPNLSKTLAAFDEAMTTIGDGKFNVRELEEAKLEVIQKMDSPVSPGGRAVTAFGWDREGRTTEVRQAFRERTLAATPDEIRSAVALLRERTETSSIVSFAGKELLERENSELATIGRTPLEIHEISD